MNNKQIISFEKGKFEVKVLIFLIQLTFFILWIWGIKGLKYIKIDYDNTYTFVITYVLIIIVVSLVIVYIIINVNILFVRKKFLEITDEYIIIYSPKDKSKRIDYYYWKDIEKIDLVVSEENELIFEIYLLNNEKIIFQIDGYWWLKKQSVMKLKKNYKNFIDSFSHISIFIQKFSDIEEIIATAKDNRIKLNPW